MTQEYSPSKELSLDNEHDLTDEEKIARLESIVERQRTVVIDQRSSIAGLLHHVSELERIVHEKDEELAKLRFAVEQQERAGEAVEPQGSHASTQSDARADFVGEVETLKHGVHQRLQETEQARQRAEDQLKDAARREDELREEVCKLRDMMAERGWDVHASQSASKVSPTKPSTASQLKLPLPLPSTNQSTTSTTKLPPKVKDDQLGKVRSNLLAAEEAIEKLRVKVAKNSSMDSSRSSSNFSPSPHRRSATPLPSSLSPAPRLPVYPGVGGL